MSFARLEKALLEARTCGAVLDALARGAWLAAGREAPVPDCAVPDEAAMARWLRVAPSATVNEARKRLEAMYGPGASAFTMSPRINFEREPVPVLGAVVPPLGPSITGNDGMERLVDGAAPVRRTSPVLGTVFRDVAEIHADWCAHSDARSIRHPLAPMVRAWQARPPMVEPERRSDRRIVPRIRSGETPRERKSGRRLAEQIPEGLGARNGPRPRELPILPAVAPAKRVPLLDIVDAAGVPVRAKRGGAALEARFVVRTLSAVRQKYRALPAVRMALRLRELRDALFPNGWYKARDWPRLRQALINARGYAIHGYHAQYGQWGLWWPIALRFMPR